VPPKNIETHPTQFGLAHKPTVTSQHLACVPSQPNLGWLPRNKHTMSPDPIRGIQPSSDWRIN
jgi:hypothetical protein